MWEGSKEMKERGKKGGAIGGVVDIHKCKRWVRGVWVKGEGGDIWK